MCIGRRSFRVTFSSARDLTNKRSLGENHQRNDVDHDDDAYTNQLPSIAPRALVISSLRINFIRFSRKSRFH